MKCFNSMCSTFILLILIKKMFQLYSLEILFFGIGDGDLLGILLNITTIKMTTFNFLSVCFQGCLDALYMLV